MLSAVVEAYFRNHPEKRRPLKDMQDLDTMNKITRDMVITIPTCFKQSQALVLCLYCSK